MLCFISLGLLLISFAWLLPLNKAKKRIKAKKKDDSHD
jgi:hypothetical protein